MSENDRPPVRWRLALVLLPALLAVTIVGAVALKVRRESRTGPDARLAMAASAVSAEELAGHMKKLTAYIGERNWETPEGRKNLRYTIAYIDGTLSPQNYGFEVQRDSGVVLGGELWPSVWADLPGKGSPIVAVAAYDGDARGVAALLAAANDLRDEEPGRPVRFAFYPAALWNADLTRNAGWLADLGAEGTLVRADGMVLAGEGLAPKPAAGEDMRPALEWATALATELRRRAAAP